MRIRPRRSRQRALGLGVRPGCPSSGTEEGESEKGDRAHRGSEDNEIILGSAGWQQEEKEMGGWEGYEGEAGRLGTCKFTTPSCP